MTYQATTDRAENPFQQLNNQDDNFEDEEDTTHNIKFTIPPNSNEKGKLNLFKFAQGRIIFGSYNFFLTILCSPFCHFSSFSRQLSGITS